MRPWMIAAAAAAVGLVAAVAWLWLGPGLSLGGGWGTLVRADAPLFALVLLAVSAAIVLLLTTAAVAFDLARVGVRIDEIRSPSAREWIDAFAGTNLLRLAARILDLAPEPGPADSAGLVLQSRFAPAEARREVLSHHGDWLLRAQFASALALVVVIAGLGLAQDYGHAALGGFLIPSGVALAALAVLVLLLVCARLFVTAMTEPLIDAIAHLPLPRVEMRLLQALSAIGERERELGRIEMAPAPIAAANLLLERLAAALEEDRDTLREAISRLSSNSATLAKAATAIASRGGGDQSAADPAAIAQLHEAIAGLTATIERLQAAAPPEVGALPAVTDPPRRRRAARRTDLGAELRRLISEFD